MREALIASEMLKVFVKIHNKNFEEDDPELKKKTIFTWNSGIVALVYIDENIKNIYFLKISLNLWEF